MLAPLSVRFPESLYADREDNERIDMPKVRDATQMVEDDGWVLVRTRGSHRQYKHPSKRGLVTIPGRASDDLAPGTWASIVKQAQLAEGGDTR